MALYASIGRRQDLDLHVDVGYVEVSGRTVAERIEDLFAEIALVGRAGFEVGVRLLSAAILDDARGDDVVDGVRVARRLALAKTQEGRRSVGRRTLDDIEARVLIHEVPDGHCRVLILLVLLIDRIHEHALHCPVENQTTK